MAKSVIDQLCEQIGYATHSDGAVVQAAAYVYFNTHHRDWQRLKEPRSKDIAEALDWVAKEATQLAARVRSSNT